MGSCLGKKESSQNYRVNDPQTSTNVSFFFMWQRDLWSWSKTVLAPDVLFLRRNVVFQASTTNGPGSNRQPDLTGQFDLVLARIQKSFL